MKKFLPVIIWLAISLILFLHSQTLITWVDTDSATAWLGLDRDYLFPPLLALFIVISVFGMVVIFIASVVYATYHRFKRNPMTDNGWVKKWFDRWGRWIDNLKFRWYLPIVGTIAVVFFTEFGCIPNNVVRCDSQQGFYFLSLLALFRAVVELFLIFFKYPGLKLK